MRFINCLADDIFKIFQLVACKIWLRSEHLETKIREYKKDGDNMLLSKQTLELSFKGKSVVELEDLVHLIENHFGYHVQLTPKEEPKVLTDTQKKRLTSIIFNDPNVINQLAQAEKDRQNGVSTYSDDEEEFSRLLSEVKHDL
ncbi:MAG: hypothetical protein K0Q94_1737 [Paenibacillus sp.]|nr:hypothetical protein [Paenibacillus sp.]